MSPADHIKLIHAGFTILRKDNYPEPRIKIKGKNRLTWRTLKTFKSTAERDSFIQAELLKKTTIED